VANSLQTTLNWTNPFIEYSPLTAGTGLEPAKSIGNMDISTILNAPFAWPFNRSEFVFPTVVGQQDYNVGICDFGYLEKVSLKDPTSGMIFEIKDVMNTITLGRSSQQQKPAAICVLEYTADNTCAGTGGLNCTVSSGPVGVQNILVNITSAQLKAAHTTPINLIPAPPCPNNIIVPLSVVQQFNVVTTPYTVDPNFTIGYGSAYADVLSAFIFFELIDFSATNSNVGYVSLADSFPDTALNSNEPISWVNGNDLSADPGDGTVTLNIQYIIVNILTGQIIGGNGNAINGSLVNVTSSQLLLPYTSVTPILPAPGPNRMIVPLQMAVWSHYNTVPMNSSDGWYIGYGNNFTGADHTSVLAIQPHPFGHSYDEIQMGIPTEISQSLEFMTVPSAFINQGMYMGNLNGHFDNIGPPNADTTATIYVQYLVIDVTTGAIIPAGSTGGDVAGTLTNLSASQINGAYVTPVTVVPSPGGASLLQIPLSSANISRFVTTPYSVGSGGIPNPVIGIGPTATIIRAQDYMTIATTPPLFTATNSQFFVTQPTIYDLPNADVLNAPVQYTDYNNLAGNTADSTGTILVQYLTIDTITGNILTQVNGPSGTGSGGSGVTFRFMGVPDKIYSTTLIYQKKPVPMALATDPWSGIPDQYSDIYNNLFLAESLAVVDDPRNQLYRTRGIAALLAKAEGLNDMQRNFFLSQWLNRSSEGQIAQLRVQSGQQARSI
jgi:hypothetical protein